MARYGVPPSCTGSSVGQNDLSALDLGLWPPQESVSRSGTAFPGGADGHEGDDDCFVLVDTSTVRQKTTGILVFRIWSLLLSVMA